MQGKAPGGEGWGNPWACSIERAANSHFTNNVSRGYRIYYGSLISNQHSLNLNPGLSDSKE